MLLHRILPLLTAGAILISCGITPAPAAGIPVHPIRTARHITIAHGTLANRHFHHAIAATPKPAVTRVFHARTAVAVRHVTRARRLAHVAHVHRRRGGVMGHVYSAGEPVAGATVAVAHSARAKNRHLRATHRTVTDAAGHFVMRGIAAGGHRLVATKTGVGHGSKAVHIRGGQTRSGVQIKLAATHHKHKKHRHKK
jgi:Carboxypeptidase regulatory-like domain